MEAAARLITRPPPLRPAAAVRMVEPVVAQNAPLRVQRRGLPVAAPVAGAALAVRHAAPKVVTLPDAAAARVASEDQTLPLAAHSAPAVRQPGLREVLNYFVARANSIRGWALLCAVLGRNPITGELVARTPQRLIGGFMRLIGRAEVWLHLQQSGAVPRAMAWFQRALAGLWGFVSAIPGLFIAMLRNLSIGELLNPVSAFARIVRVFVNVVRVLANWARQRVVRVLQIIFEVLAPTVLPFLRRAGGAFRSIISNPIGFVRNLVRAAILGLRQFAANILNHLRGALFGWLTGVLGDAGIDLPQAFTPRAMLAFMLSVLGVTWQTIRARLIRRMGESVVNAVETGADFVRALIRHGLPALWDRLLELLGKSRDLIIGEIRNWVVYRIVVAAIERLVSMLNPASAFIQAILAIHNTIMFFTERLRQIVQVGRSFLGAIASVAQGAVTATATRVEHALAGLLTQVLSFLARLVGLGRIGDAIIGIIQRLRAPLDRALDAAVDWLIQQHKKPGTDDSDTNMK